MEPTREKNATLADVLDRVLDKGLLIKADIIISLADVPLIGISLHAAIASVETMLDYGMMEDWVEAERAVIKAKKIPVETLQTPAVIQ